MAYVMQQSSSGLTEVKTTVQTVVGSLIAGGQFESLQSASSLSEQEIRKLSAVIAANRREFALFAFQARSVSQSDPQYFALFTDHDKKERIPIPVDQTEDPATVLKQLEKCAELTRTSDPDEAVDVFSERFAEFYMQAENPPPGIINLLQGTVVNSNRAGDIVLFAKGFFLSTGAAFGTSTPAVRQIPDGRYSFGILETGMPKFESVVWNCPAIVKLNLP